MAPTDPAGAQEVPSAASAPPGTVAADAHDAGDEPLTADLGTPVPRVSTRALVVGVGVLALLVLVVVVVVLVVLHQPDLIPVPVPSVSSIP